LALVGTTTAAELEVPKRETTKRARPKAPKRAPAQTAPAQAPAQTANWSGTQGGGFGGQSQMSNTFVEPGANQFFRSCSPLDPGCVAITSPLHDPETDFQFRRRKSSFTGGVFLGHNVQMGNLVVGVEADVAVKDRTDSDELHTMTSAYYDLPQPDFPVGAQVTAVRTEVFRGSIKQGWDASARVRFGALVTPTMLLYVTGGGAVGKVSGSFSYHASTFYEGFFPENFTHDTTSGSASWSETRFGYTIGGGIEKVLAFLGPNVKARIEYRYTSFGSFSKDVPLTRTVGPFGGSGCLAPDPNCYGTPNVGSTNAHIDMKASFQTVRLGIGFGFGP
jgi:outer membrane immunogenic protein